MGLEVLLPLLIGGASVGGGLFSQMGAARDARNRFNQNFAFGNNLIDFFNDAGQAPFQAGRSFLNDIIGNGGGFMNGLNPNQQNVFGQLQGLASGAPSTTDLFANAGQFLNPINFSPTNRTITDVATQDAINRGRTEETDFARDRAMDLFGIAAEGTAPAAQAGLDIIQSGGRTGQSQQVANSMLDLINSGGVTSQNSGALARGNQLIDTGGMTPALRNIQSQLNSLIQGGGLTREGRQMFRELMPLIESGGRGGALMPFENALSFARDAAATAGLQQAEAVRRNALQRGGAPGAVVSSGLQNQALADFGDQLAQNEARALREAAAAQQGLQLQQFLGTQGTLSNLLGQAQQIRGQATAGLGNVASATAANMATGGRLIDSSLANQLGTLQSGIQGFNQNFANEIARLGTGNDIFGTAVGAFGDLSNIALRGLLDSESQRSINQQNALDSLGGISEQGITARGQNLDAAARQGTINNQLLGFLTDLANVGASNQFNAGNTLFSGGQTMFNQLPSIFASMAGQPPVPPSTVGTDLVNFGSGILSDFDFGSIFGSNS